MQRPDGPDRSLPRIHYIWTPNFALSAVDLVLVAVFVLILLAVSFAGAAIIISEVDPDGSAGAATIVPLGLVMLSFLLFLSLAGARKFRTRRLNAKVPFRIRRLEQIAWDFERHQRLSHRIVEMTLRSSALTMRMFGRAMQPLSRGETVCLNLPAALRDERPRSKGLIFEPISIADDDEQIEWLLTAHYEENADQPPTDEKSPNREDEGTGWRDILKGIGAFGGTILYLAWLAYICYRAIFVHTDFIFYLILLTVPLGWILPYFYEDKWWIVPGGLVRRETRFWRKRDRVMCYWAGLHALVVDMRTGTGAVKGGDGVHAFKCEEVKGLAVLCGWVSSGRRPSHGELQAFFGAGADVQDSPVS